MKGTHDLCSICKEKAPDKPDSEREHLRIQCALYTPPAAGGKGGGKGACTRDRGGRRGHGRALGAKAETETDDEEQYYDESDGVDID